MLSIIIAISIFILSSLVGILVKRSIAAEYEKIKEYYDFLLIAKDRLLNEKCPIEDVFIEYLNTKKSPYISAILNNEIKDKGILEFWKSLGKTTYIGMGDIINKHVLEIDTALKTAKANYDNNARSYSKLGVIIGLFLFVLLI